MIEFILCDDDSAQLEVTTDIINSELMFIDVDYKIVKFSNYTEDLGRLIKSTIGNKIYILDVEMPGKSGLDIAREIRDADRISDIIILTGYGDLQSQTYKSRLSILDFVVKDIQMEENIRLDIKEATNAISKKGTLVVKGDGIIHLLQYKDILCITKISNSKKCSIKAQTGEVIITHNISKIYGLLDERFLRTHRSCIANFDNISKVNFKKSEITFNNGENIFLISRNKRKEIQNKIMNK